MPAKCSVKGCTGYLSGKSFFNLPAVLKYKYSGERVELCRKRRKLWLEALGIQNEPTTQVKVCSEHFLTGKPAALEDSTDIDWVPSLRMRLSNFSVNGNRTNSTEKQYERKQSLNRSVPSPKDNIRSNSFKKTEPKRISNCKIRLDGNLRCTFFRGTNGSGLAILQKYGKFTSENITLRETAINNTVLRVQLIREDLIDLQRKYRILAHSRKRRKEQPVSSFGRQIKKKNYSLDFDYGRVSISKRFEDVKQSLSDTHYKEMQHRNSMFLGINRQVQNQSLLEDKKPSIHSKIQSRPAVIRQPVEDTKTLNKVIKKNDKDKIKVKFFPKTTTPAKSAVRNGTISNVNPQPLKLHREILFVKQFRNELLWDNSDTTYYLKFPSHRIHDDGKLKYPFQKLVTDVKYMKLPSPSWKIKVIIRQGKISAITFTNKLLLERCIGFSANSDRYTIVIDNQPALLLGSPDCVRNARDLEILLDIVQNIDAKNPMIFYK